MPYREQALIQIPHIIYLHKNIEVAPAIATSAPTAASPLPFATHTRTRFLFQQEKEKKNDENCVNIVVFQSFHFILL